MTRDETGINDVEKREFLCDRVNVAHRVAPRVIILSPRRHPREMSRRWLEL